MDFYSVIDKLGAKKRSANDYRCKCPNHNGTNSDSLSISEKNGKVVFHCFSGCDQKEVYNTVMGIVGNPQPIVTEVKANGTLSPRPQQAPKQKLQETAVYPYYDENGRLLYEKVRYEPKTFRIRVPDGRGGYVWSIGETRRVLYNLPSVIVADEVYIVEGEKDADRLTSLGLVATCNFDGASVGANKPKWLDEYNPFFAGKTVYILPDNDEPGDAHATHIYKQLKPIAKSVKVIELPDLPPHGDVSDWLDNDKTIDDLIVLCNKTEMPVSVWKVYTLEDAQKPLPPIEYVVDYFFAKSTLNIIYGAPGTMKSMLLGDMAMAILSGENWLAKPDGSGGLETTYCPVVWIDVDNGTRRSHERFGALSRARGIVGSRDVPFYYVSMPRPRFFASDINSMMDLSAFIHNVNAGLVIVDNLGLVTGDVEENSAGMGNVMANLRDVAEETNVCMTVIHHQRKAYGNSTRAGDSLRGHSSIEAALDLAVHVNREPNSSNVSLMSTKTRGVDTPQITAMFAYEHHEETRDLRTARYFGVEQLKGDPVKLAIIDLLKQHPSGLNQSQIIDMTGEAKNKVLDWLKNLENVNLLDTERGERNSKVYKWAG